MRWRGNAGPGRQSTPSNAGLRAGLSRSDIMSDEQLLAHAVDALAQTGDLQPELIGSLSHLLSTDLEAVTAAWRKLSVERQLEILTQLNRSERQNARQDFNAIYGVAIADAEPRVRRLA